jgi:XRN 5'-3' exonuclease N-terminus
LKKSVNENYCIIHGTSTILEFQKLDPIRYSFVVPIDCCYVFPAMSGTSLVLFAESSHRTRKHTTTTPPRGAARTIDVSIATNHHPHLVTKLRLWYLVVVTTPALLLILLLLIVQSTTFALALIAPTIGINFSRPLEVHPRRSPLLQPLSGFRKRKRGITELMGIKGFRSWFESQFPDAITAMVKEGAQEDFDHVLIDMNQLLHIVLRKSRSDGHCFTLLMQELDACVALATPKQSLVLAMDGPPGAAKLATQRRRRFATVYKTGVKVSQLDKLIATVKHNPSKRSQSRLKQWTRKKRRAVSETRTLCITPATDFMKQAEDAMLYWAWQRLSARHTALATNNVKVFISPSTVPGEGEVKLLEWIYNKQRRGESVAILGGDSDLVLEALVIPIASTHNVFVLLPDGNKRYLSVSLWETTRTLGRYLPHIAISSVVKVRTDLVLLLILNGNDYLPKLRGSSGFNKLFHTYLRLQREWHSGGKGEDAYFVDPDSLNFNLEFSIAFFRRLATMAPANLWSKDKAVVTDRSSPLQELNNLMDAGFFPNPMKFVVITDDDQNGERLEVCASGEDVDDDISEINNPGQELDEEGEENDEEDVDMMLVRLLLGDAASEDFLTYEIWQPRGSSLKKARQKLAAIALSELKDEQDLNSEEEESSDEDTIDGADQTNPGYAWEIHHAVEGEIGPYLYGLIWNLQTYQDGVCADYSYNYGKRLSPLAKDIAQFLETALQENRPVGPTDLRPVPFSPSVSAGISCLAALPSPVKYLVPEPYRSIPDDLVEHFYSSCMDPKNNVFDIKRFELLCEEQIISHKLAQQDIDGGNVTKELISDSHDGRRIILGDHYWTIMSKVPKPLLHPFDPPKPCAERFVKLKANNKIRVSRFMATTAPPFRASDGDKNVLPIGNDEKSVNRSYPGFFLDKLEKIEQVDYRVAYKKGNKKEKKGLTTSKTKNDSGTIDGNSRKE